MNFCQKIGLGTAQWGMLYGITNISGKPNREEISEMLSCAHQRGISIIDTACADGEAEKILGEGQAAAIGFNIVTKALPIHGSSISRDDVVLVASAFDESLKQMQTGSVYGLLVHNVNNLLSDGRERLWAELQEFKACGRIEKIGVSIYHPQQLDDIMSRYEIDIVQFPYNIYDQRFAQTGLLEKLQMAGIETHARSAFLQGLIFMSPESMPDYFSAIRKHQAKLHDELNKSGLTPLDGCLSYCLNQPYIDKIIVGCETLGQFAQILSIAEKSPSSLPDLEPYAINDEKVIDPSQWLK
jgi:aryl-alcohol dehydrogenase-like predicted oxidoreductase